MFKFLALIIGLCLYGSACAPLTHNDPLLPKIIELVDHEQIKCLASVIWHEARGEKLEGQIAVAETVSSRISNPKYPKTICTVAFQPHQFSKLKVIKYDDNTFLVANRFLSGYYRPVVGEPTHYHAVWITPVWAKSRNMTRLARVGNHIFYREK